MMAVLWVKEIASVTSGVAGFETWPLVRIVH